MPADQVELDVIVAVFADPHEARRCIDDLHRAGYSQQEIGVVAPHDSALDRELVSEHCKVAESSVVGAVAGAGLGSLWGIALTANLLPIGGSIIAGGLLASALVTAAAGAALGGLAGALVGLGVPEEVAHQYAQKLHEGHIVLTIKPHGEPMQVLAILERHNASIGAH